MSYYDRIKQELIEASAGSHDTVSPETILLCKYLDELKARIIDLEKPEEV